MASEPSRWGSWSCFTVRCQASGGGFLGVDMFFVLSGYLITSILMREVEARGRIDLYRFYRNRLLRLYPALFAMLSLFLIAGRNWWPNAEPVPWAAMAALYVTDYTRAFLGVPTSSIAFTWSLSVEEHYYLLWPLLLPLVLRSRSPAKVMLLAYITMTAWRLANFYWTGWDATYYRFDTRCSGMVLGGLIALAPPLELPGLRNHWVMLAGGAVVAATAQFQSAQGVTVAPLLAELITMGLILEVRSGHLATWLGSPAIAWLGRVSYPMYLWHSLLSGAAWAGDGPLQKVLFTVPPALALSAATYHWLERPLQQARMAPRAASV